MKAWGFLEEEMGLFYYAGTSSSNLCFFDQKLLE